MSTMFDTEEATRSFEEKVTWVSGLVTVLVAGWYLRVVGGLLGRAELADRVGMTRQTIVAIEQGRDSPSLEVAFKIARAFGVPPVRVIGYPEEAP